MDGKVFGEGGRSELGFGDADDWMEDRSLRDRVIGPAESVRITMPLESQPRPRENEPLLV